MKDRKDSKSKTPLWRGLFFEGRFPTRFLNNNLILSLLFGIKIKRFHGLQEAWMINENFNDHIYCPKGFSIMPGDTVVDIGANFGIFTLYASKKANRGKVYSFEPVGSNFDNLASNVRLSRAKNVYLFRKGVSDANKSVKINLSGDAPQMHSISKGSSAASGHELVECVSLDWIFKSNDIPVCDFLKMDCEGSEYDILFNASGDALKRIKKISMEYHVLDRKNNDLSLIRFLEKHGFSIRGVRRYDDRIGLLYAERIGY